MASASDRFVIRDYAAKMRIIDLKKSWPFEKGGMESLPPISICHFRWWADELHSSRSVSEEISGKSLPVTNITKKGSEACELSSPKAKPRTQKKRSIVELFASAPQIDSQSNREDGDGKSKDEEEKLVMRKRSGKLKKGGIKMDGISALKKGKLCKPKTLSLGHSPLLQDSNYSARLQNTNEYATERKKVLKPKALQKKHSSLHTSSLISKNQETLKRKTVYTSARKIRKTDSNTTVGFINRYCKATRHGKKRSSMNLPQFKSLCKIFSDVLAASSAMNSSGMVPASNDISNEVIINKTDASSPQKNQSTDSSDVNNGKVVNSSNSSCSITGKTTMAAGVIDLNSAIDNDKDLDCFICSTEDPDFRGNGYEKSSLHGDLPNISLASITTNERNFAPTSNTVNLLDTMNNPSLIACNDRNEGQYAIYFNGGMNSSNLPSANQSREQFFCPNNLLSSKFGGSIFMPNLVSKSKNKGIDEDCISLPLNMQGELIQMYPGTKFVGTYKKQSRDNNHGFYLNKNIENNHNFNNLELMKKKFFDSSSYQKGQLEWCQNKYQPTSERVGHQLSLTEFIDSKRLNIQSNEQVKGEYEFIHSYESKPKLFFHDGKADYATHDFIKMVDKQRKCNLPPHFEPAGQPTMRLMGQNVVIGSSKSACRTPIIAENYSSNQITKFAEDRLELLQRALLSKTEKFIKISDSGGEYGGQTHQYNPFWLLQAKDQQRNQPSERKDAVTNSAKRQFFENCHGLGVSKARNVFL